MIALSAARAFDCPLFRALGQRIGFGDRAADFRALTGFSFVKPLADQTAASPDPGDQQTSARYRIHDLLGRILAEQEPERVQAAHAALEAIFRERIGDADDPEPTAIAEAVYHANRQDWERGAREWIDRMEPAVRNALQGLAMMLAQLVDHVGARSAFEQSIAAYDQALARARDYVESHNNKGASFQGLGALRAQLGDHAGAKDAFEQAVAAYDQALARAPDRIEGLGAKALCLADWARMELEQGEREPACDRLRKSRTPLDRALAIAPGHPTLLAVSQWVDELLAAGCGGDPEG